MPPAEMRAGTEARRWQAIVIGGGPAGSVAAALLADRGIETLLVEAKRFPRDKVCGGCLSGRAVAHLNGLGFRDALAACRGAAIGQLRLYHRARSSTTTLPDGLAVSRATLDKHLLDTASHRGAVVLEGTRAEVLPADGGRRRVLLKNADSPAITVEADVIVAADGLGQPSLARLPGFGPASSSNARIGFGATCVENQDNGRLANRIEPSAIHMGVTNSGYLGVARCEAGNLCVAGVIDPAAVRRSGSLPEAIDRLLQTSGVPNEAVSRPTRWLATPRLSQLPDRLAAERLLVIGDSAGYVEPFTGEGMASAIEGASRVVEHAVRGADGWSPQIAMDWQRSWAAHLKRRWRVCKSLTWLLRRDFGTRAAVSVASSFPGLAKRIASSVGAPRKESM